MTESTQVTAEAKAKAEAAAKAAEAAKAQSAIAVAKAAATGTESPGATTTAGTITGAAAKANAGEYPRTFVLIHPKHRDTNGELIKVGTKIELTERQHEALKDKFRELQAGE